MDAKTALHLGRRGKPTGRHTCPLPDYGCSEADSSGDVEAAYETVRRISAAETGVENQEMRRSRARSRRTVWARERRGTAPHFHQQNQRLKSQNVGGGPSRNRTGVQGFAVLCVTTPPSGRGAAEMVGPPRLVNRAGRARTGHPAVRLFDRWRSARLGLAHRGRYAPSCNFTVLLA